MVVCSGGLENWVRSPPDTIVKHPAEWTHGGYREIQNPPERYTIIDLADLSVSCGFTSVMDFQRAHRLWVDEALAREAMRRDARWSEAIAVGSYDFVEKIKRELGAKAVHRDVNEAAGAHTLREQQRFTPAISIPKMTC